MQPFSKPGARFDTVLEEAFTQLCRGSMNAKTQRKEGDGD
jgi:hypothetical protein